MRSDSLRLGLEFIPHQAVLGALECNGKDISRPFIGVVNNFTEIVGEHVHLLMRLL